MLSIKEKVALITGASKGIGLATAEKFAQEGANLILLARSETLLKQTADTLESKYSVKVLPVTADLTNQEDVEKVFELIRKNFNKLDILINNAAEYFTILKMAHEKNGMSN
jgi:Short-chain alcohol dehydrogenase of unknown specificity